jgi:hypothetical protein
MKNRAPGLTEARRSGRKPTIPAQIPAKIIAQATPPAGKNPIVLPHHGQNQRCFPNTVQLLWPANDIKPHITRTFKIPNDKDFEAKLWEVIGLHLNPPERSLVLCCDEKSQCQALARTQPGLPLGPHRVRTGTHD